VLAQEIDIPVVGDFRGADIAVGGQGAPIVPFSHWFFTPASACPRLVVNFGGICNVTYVTKRLDGVLAYDVGPGMMLSDAFAERTTGGRLGYDRNGELSRKGRIIERLVADIEAHPFVARRPPKSTGREDFGRHFFEPLLRRYRRARAVDIARSLIAATATILHRSVARDRRIAGLREVLLSGGGGKNPVLVDDVRARFANTTVRVADEGVFAPDHHEAAAMALIAARTTAGLPSSLPAVTGAPWPVILGHVHQPTLAPLGAGRRKRIGGSA
jgi:anhydro-N-acetylmuramic acid kinase